MKNLKVIFLSLIFIFWILNLNITSASIKLQIISKEESKKLQKELSREDIFNYLGDLYESKLPKSYKYINVKIRWVKKESKLYWNLQKLIYLDLISNKNLLLRKDKNLPSYYFFKTAEKALWFEIVKDYQIKKLRERNTVFWDIEKLEKIISRHIESENKKFKNIWAENEKIKIKKAIFLDVYDVIKNKHFDHKNITETEMLNSAIEWLAKWSWDKFTVYFPPQKNKSFNESLNWEYEWIWAYVDMETPWELKIISPIIGSPADKAGLKWWDIIIKAWKHDVTKENSISEVISWIKWPAWTKVELTVKRWTKTFKVQVERKKIIIKEVESKMIDSKTFYIQLKFFWKTVSEDFRKNIEKIPENKRIKKIIFDLRSNPGWYLDQVTEILSYFVPKWEKTAVIKYIDSQMSYKSSGYDLVDFSKYKIVILQNSWTASASEIMIWTIKDYFPNAEIIGVKSYWKGSVQTIKWYEDGSSLKYTIAKWYTWKTETWINWIGIEPTIELKIDEEKFKKWIDNQLEKAKSLR